MSTSSVATVMMPVGPQIAAVWEHKKGGLHELRQSARHHGFRQTGVRAERTQVWRLCAGCSNSFCASPRGYARVSRSSLPSVRICEMAGSRMHFWRLHGVNIWLWFRTIGRTSFSLGYDQHNIILSPAGEQALRHVVFQLSPGSRLFEEISIFSQG